MRFLTGVAVALALTAPLAANPAREAAREIDKFVAKRWQQNAVTPAKPASDSEFLRRVYLDLAGRIPTASEARAFLADKRPNKRELLIERLLDSPRYVSHFSNYWRDLLLPEAKASIQNQFLLPSMTSWIRKQLEENAPLDKVVVELMTASRPRGNTLGLVPGQGNSVTPAAFYQAKENKAENLAASISKLFLGVKMECAQCHDHPFGDWSQEQFWSLAAFFTDKKSAISIPGRNRSVEARFLDGSKPTWTSEDSPREVLAKWVTSKRNPYFARAIVNRVWAFYFGMGLIDPVDEMVGCGNEPSHPELLEYLAREFAKNGYDLKFLLRAVAYSKTYQLSSRQSHDSQAEPTFFAKMPLRGLAPEQILDSLVVATGYEEGQGGAYPFPVVVRGQRNERARLERIFGKHSEKTSDYQTSILQALALMNGGLTANATSLKSSGTLAALLDSPFLDTEERIEALFLTSLSRKPTKRELTRYSKYIEASVGEDPSSKSAYGEALADVYWVLLNSSEFLFNH